MNDESRVTVLAEPYVPLGLPIGATVQCTCISKLCLYVIECVIMVINKVLIY